MPAMKVPAMRTESRSSVDMIESSWALTSDASTGNRFLIIYFLIRWVFHLNSDPRGFRRWMIHSSFFFRIRNANRPWGHRPADESREQQNREDIRQRENELHGNNPDQRQRDTLQPGGKRIGKCK